MLTHQFSKLPIDALLNHRQTLAVLPLTPSCEPSKPGVISCALTSPTDGLINEVWSVSDSVTHGQTDTISWSDSSEVICATYYISDEDCQDIESATFCAYKALLDVFNKHNKPFPFRFWNYLPKINEGMGENELYKKFCTGRLNAFNALNIDPSDYPAASALGHHGKGAIVFGFASAKKPVNYKNNNQINAYQYPLQYGKSSPSFARATLVEFKQNTHLMISGTASIIGHKTIATGSLEKQLEVTINNIEHLLRVVNTVQKSITTFKVYVRYPYHLQKTRSWLDAHYPNVDCILTLADICRKDLLVEIEAFCE